MHDIILVSPFRCCVWSENGRLPDYINEDTCKSEIQSFATHGQLLPVLGRPLRGDPQHDIELVFGARRLFVARHLNVDLKVEMREMSDREAIVALDVENRHRQDISPYERGCAYQSWLRGEYFKSQEEIAQTLSISASQVSRLIKLAQLPPVLINAFRTPFEVCENWGLELSEAWSQPVERAVLARRARSLAQQRPRLQPIEVFQGLMSGSHRLRSTTARARDEVVTGANGKPLFRVRYQSRTVAFLVPNERLSSAELERLKSTMADVLQPAVRQVPVNTLKLPSHSSAQQ